MLPLRVIANAQRIDSLILTMDSAVNQLDLSLQTVFSNHVVLAGSGYVEDSVIAILSEYGKLRGNNQISRFIDKNVARHNSLNCEKIKLGADIDRENSL
jgi:hypothetical protein